MTQNHLLLIVLLGLLPLVPGGIALYAYSYRKRRQALWKPDLQAALATPRSLDDDPEYLRQLEQVRIVVDTAVAAQLAYETAHAARSNTPHLQKHGPPAKHRTYEHNGAQITRGYVEYDLDQRILSVKLRAYVLFKGPVEYRERIDLLVENRLRGKE